MKIPSTNNLLLKMGGHLYTFYGACFSKLRMTKVRIQEWYKLESSLPYRYFKEILPRDQLILDDLLDRNADKINKYLLNMYDKLAEYAYKGEKEKFDSLSRTLLKHSKSVRIAAIRKILPKWEELSDSKLKWTWIQVDNILRKQRSNIKILRFELPKEDGTMRPISCPTIPWRIVSKVYCDLFTIWVECGNKLSPNLQGGRVGKGPKEVWQWIVAKAINKPVIFEFDLHKCFDSIKHEYVDECLKEINTPKVISRWIMRTLEFYKNNIPIEILEKEEKAVINEWINYYDACNFTTRWLKTEPELRELANEKYQLEREAHEFWLGLRKESIKVIGKQRFDVAWPKWLKYIKAQGPEFANIENEIRRDSFGLPQGWALSPIITNLVVNKWAGIYKDEIRMFVDDGIIATEGLNKLKIIIYNSFLWSYDSGLKISWKKSALVKVGAEWYRNLKFLGIEINDLEELKAATRSGAQVKLPTEVINKYTTKYYGRSWTKFVESFGMPGSWTNWLYNNGQSRIAGSWTKTEIWSVWSDAKRRNRYKQ